MGSLFSNACHKGNKMKLTKKKREKPVKKREAQSKGEENIPLHTEQCILLHPLIF